MRDNYVNVRFWFMLHANVFILHVDKNKSHVVINKSHANLILLHIDIVYPASRWQKYVTIQSYKCYIYTFFSNHDLTMCEKPFDIPPALGKTYISWGFSSDGKFARIYYYCREPTSQGRPRPSTTTIQMLNV